MASATVQRNNFVAPFSVKTPFLTKDEKGKMTGTLEITHQRWVGQVTEAINSTAQVTSVIPASSASSGVPGTFAFDSNFLYVCVGASEWRRAALSTF